MKNIAVAGLLLSFLLLWACNKIDDLNAATVETQSREFAIPLLSGTTTLKDLMGMQADDYLEVGADGQMALRFKGDVLSKNAKQILGYFQNVPILLKDTVTGIPLKSPTTQSIDIDRIDLKTGTISLIARSNATQNMNVTVWVPDMKKNGVPFSTTFVVPYTGTLPGQGGVILPLEGYRIQTTGDSMFVHYRATRADGTPDSVVIIGGLLNLDFSYLEGFWSKETLDFPRDTIKIDFFNTYTNGTIYFQEPTIEVIVDNSFGFPTRSKVNSLSVLTVRGDVLPLQSPFITTGIDFNYPSLNEVGQSKKTSFFFNKNNSNIAQVLGAGPVGVDYDLDAIANPDGNTAIRGFVADSSRFTIGVEVTLPFYGSALGFAAADTFAVNFDAYSSVENAEFKLITDNGTPLGVDLQGYFLDANGTVLDSLFGGKKIILEGAPVNNSGEVTAKATKITFANLDATRFTNIKTAKKIIIVSNFSTTNNGSEIGRAHV